MADVDEHGELLCLVHQVHAVGGEPALLKSAHKVAAVRRGVSAAPGQAKTANAHGVEAVEHHAGGDGLRPLEGHEDGQLVLPCGLQKVFGAGGEHQDVLGLCDLAVQGRHLLHGVFKRAVGQIAAVHKERGHHAGHMAGGEGGVVEALNDLTLPVSSSGTHVAQHVEVSVNGILNIHSSP